jgi:copper chaperone NosL
MRRAAAVILVLVSSGCAAGGPEPAPLDTRNEACATCRMAVSEARFAAQVVAPGELPRFFDDLGCLAAFLKDGRAPLEATVYVADHRTQAWVRADVAVYSRVPGLATPMGSHLIAHADAASRDHDAAARGGTPVTPQDVFGASAPATRSQR